MFGALSSAFAMFAMFQPTAASETGISNGVGGQRDDHGCVSGAGFRWCEAHQACERPWESRCPLHVTDPLRPAPPPAPEPAPEPYPVPYHEHNCPDVMCMMYCKIGYEQDGRGCPMCRCKELYRRPEPEPKPQVKPQVKPSRGIPKDCISWFDGCNRCLVKEGKVWGCTRRACFKQGETSCLSYGHGH